MSKQSEARKRFLEVAMRYSTRATANFSALIELAKRIYDAESVGLVLEPNSVEEAVKNILGVGQTCFADIQSKP